MTRIVSFRVIAVAIVLASVARLLSGADDDHSKQVADKITAMVESLASPNKEPKLVEGPRDLGVRHCQLPAKYDMAAQKQIHDAWDQLVQKGLDAFPSLIGHLDDKRYCTSAEFDDWWSNFTVGNICLQILTKNIEPWGRFMKGARGPTDVRPSYADYHLATTDAARRWYAAHKGTSLREIQVEALEWTIDQESKRIRPRNKQDVDKQDLAHLRELLAKLRTSDRPLPPGGGSFIDTRINDDHH
jgi:hypothetical protein